MPQRAQRLGSVSVQTSCTPATPLYAGVEPAHTRICSAPSCDVFARVVWIKLWGETDLSFLLYSFAALAYHALLPAAQSRMRKEFKRGKPSSFCPFRTFRTSEKYFVLHVLLHDQKYQKSSKRFPLRNLPVLSHLAKARPAPWLCQRTDFMHARHFLYMRAWNQRIRESARFFRVMCSHAWYR